MSLHKNPELKAAVLNLPNKDKDKLLIRLINKDKLLLKQLQFQLLEDEEDLKIRNVKIKRELEAIFEKSKSGIDNSNHHHNYSSLLHYMRYASGLVNEHEKVTKDKIGVLECRIQILSFAFKLYPFLFLPSYFNDAFKLQKYTHGRLKNLKTTFGKFHEDIQFDYRDQIDFILEFAEQNDLNLD